jgi:hypothetical protein
MRIDLAQQARIAHRRAEIRDRQSKEAGRFGLRATMPDEC